MGAITTILGFGAGYALGTRRDAAFRTIDERFRGALGARVPALGRRGSEARQVRDLMTSLPEVVGPDATLVEAAALMADGDIGDVLVVEPGAQAMVGIVTDRDIIVRGVAAGRDPSATTVRSVLSRDLETVAPSDTVADATAHMRAANVRRLPVVEDGRPVGIVSLADLALATDTTPTLADIAVAPPDR
jgi:CBS domain-containing protein